MVAQDSATAWDLKPNRENTNQIFNVLCNVQPVEHPRSWDWYDQQIDVTNWSKQQYRFEKCKWLKRCQLYHYECWSETKLMPTWTGRLIEKDWHNANFTDVITFWWYRIYMRKKSLVLNPYATRAKSYDVDWETVWYTEAWSDWDPDTCDTTSASDAYRDWYMDKSITNKRTDQKLKWVKDYWTSDFIRIYIQPVDTKNCTGDTFDEADEAPIILVREFESDPCNPDHFVMWYGWIWTPEKIEAKSWEWIKLAMISYWWQTFAYLYNVDTHISSISYISLWSLWIYVSWLSSPDDTTQSILSALELPSWWYFIPNVSELTQVAKLPDLAEWVTEGYEITNVSDIWSFKDYWEVPYFAAWWSVYAINWFYERKDDSCEIPTDKELWDLISKWWIEDTTYCESRPVKSNITKRKFIFTSVLDQATNIYTITWLEKWWARLCYVANNRLYVSWAWMLNGLFTPSTWDTWRWSHSIPAWLTDVRSMYGSLLLFWPKNIYAVANQDALAAGNFINATDNDDWYYSPNSFYNDDNEFLIVRRWKILETMQYSAYYWTIQFTPDTWFFVNWHIKPLSNDTDLINIDATSNNRYISIYDNNDVWPHYSKLLIYDKHYNCRYHWMITWARVVHVKDNIFLWDWVYVNKWRTWWREWSDDTKGWEIIEIISAYVWEEWLQTPKHIEYVKTAIWDHSVITTNSKRDINTSYGWKLYERRNDITATRHPWLLPLKNQTNTILTYENGEEIYWHWELLSHTLLNEVSEYRAYDKYSDKILREMWSWIDTTSKLARFASIKEPVNAPANVLELCISARKLDNVQFWSFYIAYYVLDADYEDIENTNIDVSDATDRTNEQKVVIHKWEYCDEVLAGSACDSPQGT